METVTPHCPHCLLAIGGDAPLPYPPVAMRCPQCRLIIGAGRARGEIGVDGDARSRGSAAGVLANAARRAHSEPRDRDEVMAGLATTAGRLGCAVERLRMLDYQDAADADPALPDLSSVLATFGTWKAARGAAGLRSSAPVLDVADDAANVA